MSDSALVELPTLNRYAVLQRYPGEAPAVTRRDLLDAVRLAEEAIAWAVRGLSVIDKESQHGARRSGK